MASSSSLAVAQFQVAQFQVARAAQPTLDSLRGADPSDPTAIREAARQFEAVFMQQVFKAMRSTVPKDGMTGGGFGGEVFTDMLDGEYAKLATRGTGGLADLVAAQMGAPPDLAAARPVSRGVNPGLRAYERQRDGAAGAGWSRPVVGRVSSPFGMRTLGGQRRMHEGLDLAAPEGAPIRAARAGVVRFAGAKGGYGQAVVLDHGGGTTSLYGHASALLVEAGERVAAGAVIARVGSTGHSTGPHLHFEVRRDGAPVDPRPLLGAGQ